MSKRNAKFLFWLAILALVMACVPSLAAPLPTANPNEINTFIAETANAAGNQTAAALPSSTPTATITPTPRNTDTVTPTFTSTVIFIISSPTKVLPPTLVIIPNGGGGGGGGGGSGSGGGSSSADFACQIVSVSPANGTSFNTRDNFDATWRVKNTGTKNWDRNSVDFIYLSGAKIHKVAGYDLRQTINSGQTTDLGVDMVAPKDPGTYATTWTLMVGNKTFCNMSLTIVVK
ncbi:MAG TPA: NBR1-Ig-like domain-containing protein [Anaerolineales bacterium]|nr:NBR1-Ig-like domain-containing protein [Anaerolineales bacterium]